VVAGDAPSPAQKADAEAPEHKLPTVVKMVPPAASATEPAASVSETPGPAPEKPAASGPAADKAAAGETAVRPPATPALGSTDIFIPPPAEPSGGNADKPAVSPPPAPAPDRPSDRRTARDRGPTLFERVTGTGRAARSAKAAAVDGDGAAQRHPTGGHGRPGGLDSAEHVAVAQAEEDLLDIPAFLRRQAN
jgi:cell division protein FtsZ